MNFLFIFLEIENGSHFQDLSKMIVVSRCLDMYTGVPATLVECLYGALSL